MKTLHGPHTGIIQPWTRKRGAPPTGSCQRTIIVEGKAKVCGKTCKGQLCDEHKGSTAPLAGAGRWPGGKAQSKTGRF